MRVAVVAALILAAVALPERAVPDEPRPMERLRRLSDVRLAQASFCSGRIPTCKAIPDCATACRYLLECGARRLDRDRDGIPCESLCGTRRCR